MSRTSHPQRLCQTAIAILMGAGLCPVTLQGQALATGTVAGRIIDDRGTPIPEAALTFSRDGMTIRVELADVEGRFLLADLRPGRYDVLAEQLGYQPVRTLGVPVIAGEQVQLTIALPQRPPPVTEVLERTYAGAWAVPGASVVDDGSIGSLAYRPDATDLVDAFSAATRLGDARERGVLSVNGLSAGQARLAVDGSEGLLLRHPGLPSEAGTAPAFGRETIVQARLDRLVRDAALPGAPGGLLELVSRAGGVRTEIVPHASWSGATLGAAMEDNPADSSASSFIGGLRASGPIRGDTAGWALRFDVRQLATPSATPFTRAGAAEAIEAAAGQHAVAGWISPTMHRWKGASGSGSVKTSIGRRGRIAARLALASWEEANPVTGEGLANGSGVTLEASDLSVGLAAEFWGEDWRSITRLGFEDGSRKWIGVGVPYTTLANDGAALGVFHAAPGDFSERLLTLGETIIAPTGEHELSAGAVLGLRKATYDWLPYGFGVAAFGGSDDLATGTGSWVSAEATGAVPELSVTEIAVFAQDAWRVSHHLQVTFGIRLESRGLPTDVVSADDEVAAAFGIVNNLVPTDRSSGVAPRLGFRWDPSGRGRTLVHGAAGLVPGRYDLAALAEVARHDGGVEVSRATGPIGWPMTPSDPLRGTAITFFDSDVRAPRAIHVTGGVSHAVTPGTVVSVTGGFQHTDYLLRREDVNLPTAPLAFTAEGRPVWGNLQQYGGLIVPAAGSNRRVDGFDHVWGLSSTGYAEQQYVTVALERHAGSGVTLAASYTWSRTEDNLPGQLSADPADRALRLDAHDPAATWSDGRSDLDVPHHVVLRGSYRSPGESGLSVDARWRWRSGLPYTPGFAPGVDVNGDGSSNNDPVGLRGADGIGALLSSVGCEVGNGAFSVRNACRGGAVSALDVGAAYRLPLSGRRRLVISVEGFNLVASAVGIVDRAAVLVDPDGTITTDAEGQLVLPLVANDHLGQLLSRRNIPRTIRFGLRVEY